MEIQFQEVTGNTVTGNNSYGNINQVYYTTLMKISPKRSLRH